MSRSYPQTRLRRNRFAKFSRNLVRETTLTSHDFIYPLFIIDGILALLQPAGAILDRAPQSLLGTFSLRF